MKSYLILGLFILANFANASVSKREMLRKIDALYEKVSKSKKTNYKNEYDIITNLIQKNSSLEFSDRFTCARGTFSDEFHVFDKVSNRKIGDYTTSKKCNTAIRTANNGLVCTRGTFKDEFKIGVGEEKPVSIDEMADGFAEKLVSIFKSDSNGARPFMGENFPFSDDPNFNSHLFFYEFFHAETGQGLGASHQTGWTSLVANLIQELRDKKPRSKND